MTGLYEAAAHVPTTRLSAFGVDCAVVGHAPDAPGGTWVVVLPGFGARLDDFELQRFRLLAAVLDSPLLVLETPGVGGARTTLSAHEAAGLLVGSYRPLARRLLAVVDEMCGAQSSLSLLGYSLGSSVAAAMAGAASSSRVQSLTLVEPVALRRWWPWRLARASAVEDAHVDEALRQTLTVPDAILPTDRHPDLSVRPGTRRPRLRPFEITLAVGLCWGRLGSDLHRSPSPLPHVLVVRAERSVLSSAAAVRRVGRSYEERGGNWRCVELPGAHAVWQSLPRVIEIAQKMLGGTGDA